MLIYLALKNITARWKTPPKEPLAAKLQVATWLVTHSF